MSLFHYTTGISGILAIKVDKVPEKRNGLKKKSLN